MEAVRGIILSVVCAALICGILTDLSAKTGFSKLIRLSCSIFLAFTMIAPILRLRFPEWEAQKNQYFAEAQDAALAGENIRLRSVAGIIRQEAEAYILKEAKSIGANLEVEVELDSGDPPAPAAVTVRGDFDESAETQLSRLLEDELGIPKEHQDMDQTAVPFLKQFFAKYKPVLLILLVGIVLMLLPVGSKEKAQDTAAQPSKKAEETVSLQDQLSELLSQMAGAGKVKVLLTEAAGEETVYQSDKDSTTDENHQTDRSDTVILTDSARSQEGLICQINPPTYLGAVVLCQGADQPSVRLAITEAVANATGLGYHKITILKMK